MEAPPNRTSSFHRQDGRRLPDQVSSTWPPAPAKIVSKGPDRRVESRVDGDGRHVVCTFRRAANTRSLTDRHRVRPRAPRLSPTSLANGPPAAAYLRAVVHEASSSATSSQARREIVRAWCRRSRRPGCRMLSCQTGRRRGGRQGLTGSLCFVTLARASMSITLGDHGGTRRLRNTRSPQVGARCRPETCRPEQSRARHVHQSEKKKKNGFRPARITSAGPQLQGLKAECLSCAVALGSRRLAGQFDGALVEIQTEATSGEAGSWVAPSTGASRRAGQNTPQVAHRRCLAAAPAGTAVCVIGALTGPAPIRCSARNRAGRRPVPDGMPRRFAWHGRQPPSAPW